MSRLLPLALRPGLALVVLLVVLLAGLASPCARAQSLRTLTSPNPEEGGGFGYAVAGVPDADGDGRDDVLVGASGETVGGVEFAGRAYLFYGDGAVPVEELPGVPTETALRAPWPNPTTGGSVLSYDLAEASRVRLVVYDLLGREVAVLVDGVRSAGRHEVVFDPRQARIPSGVYTVSLSGAGSFLSRRITLVR